MIEFFTQLGIINNKEQRMMSNHYHWRLVIILLIGLASSCNGKNDAPLGKSAARSAESILTTAISTEIVPDAAQLLVDTPTSTTEPVLEATSMIYQLSSPVFTHKSAIPMKYSCKGENISPELTWSDPPNGTVSYGLIMDDPDAPAGTWVHWVMYNINGKLRGLPESVPVEKKIANLGVSGINSWSQYGYGGPCPPVGTHRYFFRLYALDTLLELKSGATKPDLIKAMQGHILAMAELMGTYTR
jgi:Raf kinase inhibitor-like YbhB/YbcL family protein